MVAFVHPIHESNRRAHPRTPLPGTAAYLSEHRLLIARVGDFSPSGAFLSTSFPDPVGTRATLDVVLADGERVQLDVEVVRVSFFGGRDGSKAGMGVAFVDVPRALRRRLVAGEQQVADG